ncbi:hypothetical protein NKR23_g7679 [Pleurostoma richardsiae]|uniref:Ornithine decarboxylase antizyme n=1 Tax=Pleurostoma richardsiae TaxID=41990 RepID=A0AA38RHC0_9PEZI|nr:hypothetical protein NKR23_g7679 [Pleurostoma richardsiae]
MRAVFLGERNTVAHGSGLTGVHHSANASNGCFASYNKQNGQLGTPPDESPPRILHLRGRGVRGSASFTDTVTAWLEVWDYAGSTSFRAFIVGQSGQKSLFAFFDANVLSGDLKQALVALIELADSALACSQLVICMDRSVSEEAARTLKKGLQWAGFSPTTLDYWADGLDVTSRKWLFMGMEI